MEMQMVDAKDAEVKGPAAPYTAFQSLKTMAKQMKEHGVPSRVDRSVLTNFSGAVGSQVITALKFLKLTDDDGHPTVALRKLVDAYDTDAWATVLAQIIRDAYAPIFKMDLETASPGQFSERFRATYPGADAVLQKSTTFFLNAVREANIKVSPYIMKNKKPRSGPAKKRAAKTNGERGGVTNQPPPAPAQPTTDKLPSEIMLSLFDHEMKDAEKQAVWTLIQYFKMKGK
jgi:hypothetical protein